MNKQYNPDDIKAISFVESVRTRSALYLGDLNCPDMTTRLFLQSLCHALDEVIDEKCNKLEVQYFKESIIIEYNSGMSLNKPINSCDHVIHAVSLLSEIAACCNLKKHFEVGSEYCEIGMAVLTALSKKLTAMIVFEGKYAEINFKQGVLVNDVEVSETSKDDYTKLSFSLDHDVLPVISFNRQLIENELNKISNKFKNLNISFR